MKKGGKRAISLKIIFFLFIVLALFLLVIATDFFCSGEASFFRFRAVFLLFLLLLLSSFSFAFTALTASMRRGLSGFSEAMPL